MSNKYLNIKLAIARTSTRWMYAAVAVLVFLPTLLVVMPGQADAYNQVTGRSIELSSTANAATNVAWKVGFTTVTNNQTVGSVVVKVCKNSPILGDTCTAPTSFNWNTSTLTVNNITGNITGLTVDTTDSTSNRLVLVPTGGPLANVANGAVSFTLGNGTTNGVTNPDMSAEPSQTFYARIMTFTNSTGADGGNENTNATDAGGIAMSINQQLRVTAKVQEALLFCVYTGATCAAGGSDVTLGDANGVLASTTTTYKANANFDVSSNAVSGVSIRMQGNTLKSGANFTIAPQGPTCTADSGSSSVDQFGLRMLTLGAGVTATTPYNCAANNHSFDSSTTSGIPSTFGQEIAKTSGASDIVSSTIEFGAKSANTSTAGVYTTTLTLIATATY